MWYNLTTSVLNDLTTGHWITRLLFTGLVCLSLFSLGYLGGSSVQTLRTMIQPAPSLTKTNGLASGRLSGSLMERHEKWQASTNFSPSLKPALSPSNIKVSDGK